MVRAAGRSGLRVAPQSTGHGAAPLVQHRLGDAVLLRTLNLTGVTVEAERQVARVGTGTLWQDVVEAAAPHGLVALHGSSPDVGVVGYTLGGGIGWYARKLGLAANSVVAAELVTADGELVRADADHHSELFWALRGGGGNFGVVTALEIRLFPVADAYAGMMLWDIRHAEPVLRHWARWSQEAPDEVTTSLRVMRFPPMPELPDFLRGRQVVVVDGAVLGDDAFGAEQVAGLRALAAGAGHLREGPGSEPGQAAHGPGGADSLGRRPHDDRRAHRPGRRRLPGRLRPRRADGAAVCRAATARRRAGRPDPSGGAVPCLEGSHCAFFVAIAATPELAEMGERSVEAGIEAMRPWSNGRSFLNLAEGPVDTSTAFPADTWARLRAVRAAVDPTGLFVANHAVPVGGGAG